MAKADLIKFRDLLVNDPDFQEELRAAAEAYNGEQDEKSVFENLLLPLGKKHGLSATYEEFKEFTGAFAGDADGELSEDELSQVAGGKDGGGGGLIWTKCVLFGVGIGAGGALKRTSTGYDTGMGICIGIGAGGNGVSCAGSGDPIRLV